MRFGLDRMHKLMTALGMPQRRFASLHVVGSNGKSSTVRFAAAILARARASGRLHLAAPALVRRADRGRRAPVPDAEFAAAVARVATRRSSSTARCRTTTR